MMIKIKFHNLSYNKSLDLKFTLKIKRIFIQMKHHEKPHK